jgi:multicomponent Na+:H+ antiporter subunit E
MYILVLSSLIPKTTVPGVKVIKLDNKTICQSCFNYHTDLKHDWQIVLLSNLITLTPGTVVLGISDDSNNCFYH